ncbi:MAG: Rrf2 family transcriptional regulator [Syntrophomonadaceae bacterium]|nr:Rrf2 family transcriptional regulator [Syntrophomonadaceae bacterium]
MLSSRFPVAVQILILLAWCPKEVKLTSDIIAFSVNTNPVIIRRIMGQLKKHGLITTASSKKGARLLKSADEITLLDVYNAVELTEDNKLFGFHANPNPHCPVGSRINEVLELHLGEARAALENALRNITIQGLMGEFQSFEDFMATSGQKLIERFLP